MKDILLWSCCLALAGLGMSGCRCSRQKEHKDASVKVIKTKQEQPDAGLVKQVSTPGFSASTSKPVKATPVHPLGLDKMPGVSRTEIEQDPRLDNPNLPYASKRTLKILEKLQKSNPNLTRPDDWFKAEPDADNVKGGPPKHP